ncbi:hypothetical protein [Psychrobacillus sp. FSL H8-0510]|uniref:hypothetical protein n=1 Tax=Psychrobacillus sp. FSL H8-0510 TaxID=2921394 RepID=UPI0030F83922
MIKTPFYIQASSIIPSINPENEFQADGSSDFLGNVVGDLAAVVVPIHYWGIIGLTAIFIIGTLVMILSALFKNGQWQKYGQNSMFWSFLVMLLLRGGPILVLSIRDSSDVDSLLQDFVLTLSYSAIFLGALTIAASGLYRFGYNLIEHPEFYRRSKALVMVSVLMMAFAMIIPKAFQFI